MRHTSPCADQLAAGSRRRAVTGALIAGLVAVHAGQWATPAAHAQPSYPTRNVTIVVPFPPGGSTDIMARTLGQKLTELWGQQVLVENRTGAGGNIGTADVVKANPDGHRLLIGSNGSIAVNPSLYRKLSYDTQRDLAPISLFATLPLLTVIHPSVPARSMKELIELARRQPGQLYYGSGGNGTQSHLCGELLRSLTGINVVHVPYKGSTAAITDIISGQISILFSAIPAVQQHVRTGKLRALAVLEHKRAESMPEVPTAAQSGVPGFEVLFWNGLFAPAATPKEIIARVHADVRRALAAPDVQERMRTLGAQAMDQGPEPFAALIAQEIPRYAKLVREANMRLD